MKLLALILALIPVQAIAADFNYNEPAFQQYRNAPVSYTGMLERKVNAYSNALIIETVQQKCYNYLKIDFPRDRLIPNKQYFLMGFDPPVQQKIIEEAKLLASKQSDAETFRKGLNPGQILSEGAWCRLVAPDLMLEAKEDMLLYMD